MFPWAALAIAGSSLLDALLANRKYPPEIEALLKSLGQQGLSLSKSPGYSEGEISALFGKNYENVRAQGKNVRQGTTEAYGRAGMLGTGAELAAGRKSAWDNENLVTNAIRDMVIANATKKQQDLSLATQIAGAGVGADVSRVNKGPALTDIATMIAMMSMGNDSKKLGALGDEVMTLSKDLYDPSLFSLAQERIGPGFDLAPADWLTHR
jgi:hypothetical protein